MRFSAASAMRRARGLNRRPRVARPWPLDECKIQGSSNCCMRGQRAVRNRSWIHQRVSVNRYQRQSDLAFVDVSVVRSHRS